MLNEWDDYGNNDLLTEEGRCHEFEDFEILRLGQDLTMI